MAAILLLLAALIVPASNESNPADSQTDAPVVPLSLTPAPVDPLDEPLVTDRPDFTESALTIPAGHLQLESGYTFTYNRDDGVRTKSHTFPEFLLRVGVAEDVELRVGWAGWTRTEDLFRERNDAGRTVMTTDVATGGNDLYLGMKFHLLEQDGLIPELGVIVAADLPAGHMSQTSGDVDPFVGLLWSYDLAKDWALSGNLNMAVPTEAGSRYVETSASLSLGYSISDDVGAYIEYFGFYPAGAHQSDAHYINGGMTYLVTNDLQLDIRVGSGLNDEADDLFAGVGFAIRY